MNESSINAATAQVIKPSVQRISSAPRGLFYERISLLTRVQIRDETMTLVDGKVPDEGYVVAAIGSAVWKANYEAL